MPSSLLLHSLRNIGKIHGMRIEIISEAYFDYLMKIYEDDECEFGCAENIDYVLLHGDGSLTFICNESGDMFCEDMNLEEFLNEIAEMPLIIYKHEDLE